MIEEVLLQHMTENAELSALLTSFYDRPAVFQNFAPKDTDKGWGKKAHYPQIVFDIDTSADVARKIAGVLRADTICINSNKTASPEQISAVVKNIIDGYFFSSGEDTFAAVWDRTDTFSTEPDYKVIGNTLTFSLLAFPAQTTSDPDPIALMNNWTAELFPDAVVFGKDAISSVFKPTNEKPAIYWSLQGISPSSIPSTYHCTWHQSNLRLSVIAPSKGVRNSIIKQVIEKLSADGRVMFPDGGQFVIHRLLVSTDADPIRTGQLTLEGSYGILRKYPTGNPLNNPTFQ